jgi:hypothetical protein
VATADNASAHEEDDVVQPTRYEIVVLGELSHRFGLAFEGMEVHAHAGRTTISGWVVDQAQLHGLIDRVGELGLELVDLRVVEIRRTPPSPDLTASGARDLPGGGRA